LQHAFHVVVQDALAAFLAGRLHAFAAIGAELDVLVDKIDFFDLGAVPAGGGQNLLYLFV
jgi:hypothetical protein